MGPPATDSDDRCVVCGSPDLVERRPGEIDRLDQVSFSYSFSPEHNRTFRVVRCRRCTHMFCAPLPEAIEVQYHDVVDEEYLKHAESRRLAAQAVMARVIERGGRGTLLDVGCATGDFLEAARAAGFDAEGLELSSWSCAVARGRGFTIHQRTLAEFAGDSPARFDVVSLIGVIEHLPQPRAEMDHLAALVKPGGMIVVWTGDADAWLPRLLGRRWWYWQGQHIQYFTHASLTRLARASGFEAIATERYPFAATHATLSNSLRRYPLHRLITAALLPVFWIKPVVYLRLPGEMLFMARHP
jgi:2-polyprenyl-3-methyl-5-hydroxy-6-metoxy-1,4-benzoquinol methylase